MRFLDQNLSSYLLVGNYHNGKIDFKLTQSLLQYLANLFNDLPV